MNTYIENLLHQYTWGPVTRRRLTEYKTRSLLEYEGVLHLPYTCEGVATLFPGLVFSPEAEAPYAYNRGIIEAVRIARGTEDANRLAHAFMHRIVSLALFVSKADYMTITEYRGDGTAYNVPAIMNPVVRVFPDDYNGSFYWEESTHVDDWEARYRRHWGEHDPAWRVCSYKRDGMNGGLIFHRDSLMSGHGPWSIHT